MRSDVLPYLTCPVCAGRLRCGSDAPAGAAPGALRCQSGHSFDIARQGYVHLGTGRGTHRGDTPAMVAARADFLAAGHYDFIAGALADAARTAGPTLVVDAGAGTGWHLAHVLDALPGAVGVALDASKAAARRAAGAHPRAAAVRCDTWGRLPLVDGAAGVVLNVFAPRNGPEFRRVLRPDGLLLVVTPSPDHLAELVPALDLLRVDPEKPARVAAGLGAHFTHTGTDAHRRTLRLTREHVRTLVTMGPSAWHADPDALAARIAELPSVVPVTASVQLGRYRPR